MDAMDIEAEAKSLGLDYFTLKQVQMSDAQILNLIRSKKREKLKTSNAVRLESQSRPHPQSHPQTHPQTHPQSNSVSESKSESQPKRNDNVVSTVESPPSMPLPACSPPALPPVPPLETDESTKSTPRKPVAATTSMTVIKTEPPINAKYDDTTNSTPSAQYSEPLRSASSQAQSQCSIPSTTSSKQSSKECSKESSKESSDLLIPKTADRVLTIESKPAVSSSESESQVLGATELAGRNNERMPLPPAAKEENAIFVGDLHHLVTRSDLSSVFGAIGKMVWIQLFDCHAQLNRPFNFAFVYYENRKDAKRCIGELNFTKFYGNPCRVMLKSRDQLEWTNSNLIVKNLPPNTKLSENPQYFQGAKCPGNGLNPFQRIQNDHK